MKVLVGVDDSQESRDAVTTAFEFFGPDASYTIMAVGASQRLFSTAYGAGTFVSGAALTDRFNSAEQTARSRAEAAAESLPVDSDVESNVGHPGTLLCAMALESDIDAIVIGSHDKNAWERLLAPSVGRYLIENAPCPVLVVR